MTSGLVLIAAVLVLGGVIATLGDRIGSRVGKARLSLFNLRPRQTATVVSIATGSLISASTLGILFAISDQLRTGVFELRQIQDDLATARQDLDAAQTEKTETEAELNEAINRQQAAQRRLRQINRTLETAIARQEQTEDQLIQTQAQLSQAEASFQQAQAQLGQAEASVQQTQAQLTTVSQQAANLRSEIQQLQTERQELITQQEQVRAQIAQRDQEIAARNREVIERDRAIAARDQAISEKENLLQDLESQRAFLRQEVQILEREFQGLRQGNVALFRNQILTYGVLRIADPRLARQAVDQLLWQANRVVLERVRPGVATLDAQVIQITNTEVEQLVSQIQDGQDYVIRLLSAGNYVIGEPCVVAGEPCIQVLASAVPNQIVFFPGEVITATTADATTMTDERLVERINLLVAASQFRIRQAGILTDAVQVSDGRTETVVSFFEALKEYNQPVEVQAVAAEITYTSGPVRIELVAVQNGQILFGTN